MLKMIKNGFAAVIALLAITATIAAQAGVFEGTKAAPPTGCYQAIIIAPNTQVNLPAECGEVDFCAIDVVGSSGSCAPNGNVSCCFVVDTEPSCPNDGIRVTEVRCGDFTADAK